MKKKQCNPIRLFGWKKLFLMMRLTALLLLIGFVHVSASVYSQKTSLELRMKNVTVEQVLQKIEEQSNFYFLYRSDFLKSLPEVSIDAAGLKVEEVLDKIVVPYGFEYEIDDKVVVIRKAGEVPVLSQQSQNLTVSGKVKDSSGQPLPGVSVVVKGTMVGMITDVDGIFSLKNISGSSTLVFSFVGMKMQEIPVNGKTVLNVVMNEESIGLDEVVAIGYGTVKKSDLTGSVASVKSDDLNQGVVLSVDQAMQGRIAGVQISQSSAEPGGGLSIRIRGANSITAGDEPLYVIDGLPINNTPMFSGGGAANIPANASPKSPLNSINPNDIESIEVLKDASATAIYGSRGANGVILITTKKGSKGKMDINLDSYVGYQEVYKHADILSTQEYMKAMNDLAADRGEVIAFDAATMNQVGNGTFWPGVVTQKALVNSNNLSMRGGSERTQFFMSANYLKQDGILRSTGIERYAFRVNLTHELSKKLSIGVNLTNSLLKNQHNTEGSGNTELGPYYAATVFDPTLSVYQPDGSLTLSEHLTVANPVYLYEGLTAYTETNRVLGGMYLDYKIIPGLSAKLRIGVDRNTGRQDLYSKRSPVSVGAILGAAQISMNELNSRLLEYTMTYQKEWNEKYSLTLLGGATYEDFINRSFYSGISEFPTDVLGTDNIGLGNIEKATLGSYKSKNSLLSYLFRANFSLFNKMLITTSFRADGSSRFGENNKFAYFPSFALAYKLSEEEFIPDVVNELKVRASWGNTGNQEIGNYASLSTYTTGSDALIENSPAQGTTATRIANPDLKWETTTQYDFGFDFGLFDNRVSGSVDYFIKDTKEMLMNFPLPKSSGFGSILRNIGSMRNTGLEISINTRNISTRDFSWNTTLSFSAMKNEVTDIGELEYITTGSFYTTTFGIIKPGEPLNAYYTYKVTGIFQDTEQVAASAQKDSRPGNPIYLDANNDGAITPDDRVIVGKPWPDFTYGIKNQISYKNWDLDIYIDGQQGVELLNGNVVYSMFPPSPRMNRMREMILDRWTPENPDAKWPSAVQPATYGATNITSLAIEDASYVKLQNVLLGYTFPVKKVKWIDAAKVYVSGQNLLVLTKYSGLNPEANKNGQGNLRADKNSYPMARTYLLGLNLSF